MSEEAISALSRPGIKSGSSSFNQVVDVEVEMSILVVGLICGEIDSTVLGVQNAYDSEPVKVVPMGNNPVIS